MLIDFSQYGDWLVTGQRRSAINGVNIEKPKAERVRQGYELPVLMLNPEMLMNLAARAAAAPCRHRSMTTGADMEKPRVDQVRQGYELTVSTST